MHLIGTIYFKKNVTAFESPSPVTNPLKYFDKERSVQQHDEVWLENIRENIWDHIKFENEIIPSTEALYFHWKSSRWVINMQAHQNSMVLRPITNYGWTVTEGNKVTVIWDSPGKIQAIQERQCLLIKGCRCIAGCMTGRCACKRNKRHAMFERMPVQKLQKHYFNHTGYTRTGWTCPSRQRRQCRPYKEHGSIRRLDGWRWRHNWYRRGWEPMTFSDLYIMLRQVLFCIIYIAW